MAERTILLSQYRAALEMLRQAIAKCPDGLWNSGDGRAPFWQVAYHALFYTHLYLQDSVQAFVPWAKHRQEYQLGDGAQPAPAPPDKASVLEYLAFCEQQAADKLAGVNLDAASGFEWLPFSKLELQLYTIRHIQQHVGELMERLGSQGIMCDWVGSRPE